ncbi:MAG: c-type cytochrome [Myxococcales bacterium]|nr:c-type cytochrome [Myxococcales bacterium]
MSSSLRARLVGFAFLGLLLAPAGCGGGAGSGDPQVDAASIWSLRCANCHGPEGRGDGPAGRAISPRPRDFSDAAWQRSVSDARIQRVIVEGGAALGLTPTMAPNPDLRGRPEVVDALVRRVRGFAPSEGGEPPGAAPPPG